MTGVKLIKADAALEDSITRKTKRLVCVERVRTVQFAFRALQEPQRIDKDVA